MVFGLSSGLWSCVKKAIIPAIVRTALTGFHSSEIENISPQFSILNFQVMTVFPNK
ncbi:Uncharacterized protein dnm_010690 [Desulfonema magnum]|uniref:Uncharacterized protein n=1 Tax=Desulfonema magnum TaxID=45655 RepID=A0A975GL04_9BACT|nr:Uncharacterized protein dnm_010690 [Desulfonema magnum]